MPSAPSTPSAPARSRGRRCSSRSLGGDDATAGRAALLGRLPVASAGARRPARRDGRGRPRRGPGDDPRGRQRRARRPRALRRLADDPHRRRRPRHPRRGAGRPHLPRLPPPRRRDQPRPRPRRRARRAAPRDDDQEPPMSLAVGDLAPDFTLPDTDGGEQSPGGAPATLVVFTCNHCPYALGWHDRIAAVAGDYADVKVLAVNPNDAERYPRDSFEAMRARVSADGGW